MLYQSGVGIVPKNLYLARKLYLRGRADDELKDKVGRRLAKGFELIERLRITTDAAALPEIETWYASVADSEASAALLQQYRALLLHFQAPGKLRSLAEAEDYRAQYELAQVVQSHNLGEAVRLLKRSAEQGNNDARSELAIRMIRGKRNPPETVQELKRLAFSAAENGHVVAMVFIAGQYRNGTGGFEKDTAEAKRYYSKALSAARGDIVFAADVAGRSIMIKRSSLSRIIDNL